MRWQRSAGDDQDVIDERGSGGGGGGGGLSIPGGRVAGGGGLLGIIVTLAIIFLGGGSGGGGGTTFPDVGGQFGSQVSAPSGGAIPADQDPQRNLRDFSAYVFSNVQKTWTGLLAQQGKTYRRAKLVLYTGGVQTGGCGSASSSACDPFSASSL